MQSYFSLSASQPEVMLFPLCSLCIVAAKEYSSDEMEGQKVFALHFCQFLVMEKVRNNSYDRK